MQMSLLLVRLARYPVHWLVSQNMQFIWNPLCWKCMVRAAVPPFKDSDKLCQLLRYPQHSADCNLYSHKRYVIFGAWITELACTVGYTPGKKVLTRAA